MIKFKIPSAYEIKKLFLSPRTAYMRKKERHQTGFIKSALELHYYRPAFYRFIGANVANPNILHEAPIDADSIVLDVGAYTGDWAQHIIDRYNPHIIAFEPNPETFKKLDARAKENTKLTPKLYGIGDRNEHLRITLEDLGSSVFSNNSDRKDMQWADAEIKAVDDVWKELGLENIDLMKINIEGAEFPLLERMIQKDMLEKVDCFMIQFHEWHPRAYSRRRKIHQELSKTHKLTWNYHFIWEQWVKK